jgi:hypothetical protein
MVIFDTEELKHYENYLSLGLNGKVKPEIIGAFSSESRIYPITRGNHANSKIKFERFTCCYGGGEKKFIGIELDGSLDARFLSPISKAFTQKHLVDSGYTDKDYPEIENYQEAYENKIEIKKVGFQLQDWFFTTALMRYFHEVTKLDPEKVIDANNKGDMGDLLEAMELNFYTRNSQYYITNLPHPFRGIELNPKRTSRSTGMCIKSDYEEDITYEVSLLTRNNMIGWERYHTIDINIYDDSKLNLALDAFYFVNVAAPIGKAYRRW